MGSEKVDPSSCTISSSSDGKLHLVLLDPSKMVKTQENPAVSKLGNMEALVTVSNSETVLDRHFTTDIEAGTSALVVPVS